MVPALATLVGGLLLSYWAMGLAESRHLERVDLEFQSSSDDRIAAIQGELWLHLDAVDTIGDLLTRFGMPTRSEFHGYAEHALRVRSGFVALGLVPKVPHAERQAHEEACRKELGPAFMIRDWGADGWVAAAHRDEYFPYCYAVPMDTNLAVLGFDLGSEPIRRAALETARDQGRMTLTPGVRLAQDPGGPNGVLFVRPIFKGTQVPESLAERRDKLIGYVVGACRVDAMVEAGLSRLKPGGIDILVNDVTAPGASGELYFRASGARGRKGQTEFDRGKNLGLFSDDELIPLLNRNWRIETRPAPEFLALRKSTQPWLFLAGGVSFTALLSLFMFSDRRRTFQIMRLNSELRDSANALERRVEERTSDLEEQKQLLEDSQARLKRHNQRLVALGELRRWIDEKADLNAALKEITRIGGSVMQVTRFSVWFYDETRSKIVCQCLYEHSSGEYSEGAELTATDFPAYFAALESDSIINAAAAQTDPRTSEFTETYLRPLNIGAMLDAPVWFRGQLKGVVCFEHIGSERKWLEEEESIAGSIAELVTTALETAERRRVERQLRLTQMSVDQAGIAIEWCDCDGNFIAVNDTQCEWSQYSREELLSMHVTDVYPEFPTGTWARHWENIKAKGMVVVESHHRRKDGETYPVQIFSNYVRFENREYKLAFVYDISARREAAMKRQESEAKARSIIDTAVDGIITINDRGMIEEFNQAAERIFGYSRSEVAGKNVSLLMPKPYRHEHDGYLENYHRGGERKIIGIGREVTGRRKNGEEFPLELAIGEFVGGGAKMFTGIVRDITERVKQQSELLAAKEEAERANRAKSEFLSRMSHELRTPMNGILGFTQLLEMADLTDRSRKCVDRISSAGRHLLELINEVLDLSRVEAGRLAISPEPVRIDEVVGEVVSMVMPMAAERKIRIERPGTDAADIRVRADRQRFKQVLMNFASNGIKYNREDGLLAFDWTTEGDRVRVRVRDTGIGLAPGEMEKAFIPFERLAADDSGVEGTGLGLALTKRLAEAMDGTVGVESEKGVGSTFWVELPVASDASNCGQDSKPHDQERLAPPVNQPELTVLYIEDNPDNLRLVESILQHRPSVKLIGATQGQIGIDLARRHDPDLILLDLNLPDLNGDRVLVDLKTHEATKAIPVYMLSADAMAVSVNRLKQLGAEDYITKPFDVPDFLRRLDQIPERTGR